MQEQTQTKTGRVTQTAQAVQAALETLETLESFEVVGNQKVHEGREIKEAQEGQKNQKARQGGTPQGEAEIQNRALGTPLQEATCEGQGGQESQEDQGGQKSQEGQKGNMLNKEAPLTATQRAEYEQELFRLRCQLPELPDTSLSALVATAQGREILVLAQSGLPFELAYKAIRFDELLARRTVAASRQAAASVLGKSHLHRTEGAPASDILVPADVYATYRALMPSLSDAEIRTAYRGYLNSARGE